MRNLSKRCKQRAILSGWELSIDKRKVPGKKEHMKLVIKYNYV